MLERFQVRDLEGLLKVYDENVTFAVEPGRVEAGIGAARRAWETWREHALDWSFGDTMVLEAGDVALVMTRNTMTFAGANDEPIAVTNTGTDVMQRQPDGSWRIVVDNPWGDQAHVDGRPIASR